jgi:WD40 repeat protein
LGHSGTIRCLHLDGELHRLISGSADHTIKVYLKIIFYFI